MSCRLDHVMVRTNDLDRSIQFYEQVFGMFLENRDPHPEDGYDLAFMKCPVSDMKIELTYNYDEPEYVVGNAWGHISFYVDGAMDKLRLADEFFGLETRHRIHESTHDKKYIIGVIMSPEGIEIAVVEKLEG